MPATKTARKTFALGDRVKLDPPQPAAFNCVHGVVVSYRGKLQPRNPRVRWASGWGTTVSADALMLLTAAEQEALPLPETFPCDTAR
jgi:hypothetical protein